MKMKVVKQHHTLRSGTPTFKWTWWYEDKSGNKSPKQKVIQNKSDLEEERKLFKAEFPEGKVLFKDLTK